MGEYKTKSKKEISLILNENRSKTLSISEIKKKLDKKNIDIGLTTIYRYLNNLDQDNKVSVNIRNNGEKEYQLLRDDCSQHMHLKCKKCGKIDHLDCQDTENLMKHINKEHGFFVDTIKTVFSGVCKKCKDKGEKNGKI